VPNSRKKPHLARVKMVVNEFTENMKEINMNTGEEGFYKELIS
jgi:hypothetical protein